MKRRELKLVVNYVCEELFAECVAASMYHGTPDPKNVESLLVNFVSRISHPEPGLPPKKFFKDLKMSFNEQVSEIVDLICNLS